MKKRWKKLGIAILSVSLLTISNGYFVVNAETKQQVIQDANIAVGSIIRDAASADSEKVSAIVKDEKLLQAIIDAYNKQFPKATKTKDNLTYGDLKKVTGSLDLSSTGVTSIPANAFTACQFTEVKLPDTIKEIGAYAFAQCTALQTVNLPDTLTTLRENAFNGCTSLTTINDTNCMPSKLTTVEDFAFANNTSLKKITMSLSGKRTDVYKSAASLFLGCTHLESITIGKGVGIIPQGAFKNAGSAKDENGNPVTNGVKVIFSSDVTQIMANAFEGVYFEKNTSLDFSSCSGLAGITAEAFKDAQNIESVVLPTNTTNDSGVTLGARAFAMTTLKSMYVVGDDKNKDKIFLPDYIKNVGEGCFYGDEQIEEVSLSPYLSKISDNIFDYCFKLKKIEQRIADNGDCLVTEIGDCAFRGTAIADTEFLLNMKQLTTIGYQHISDEDYEMQKGVWGSEKDDERESQEHTDVETLPKGGQSDGNLDVTAGDGEKQKLFNNKPVGSEVFAYCFNLTSISIPGSVTSIGSRAFYQHPRKILDSQKNVVADFSEAIVKINSIDWKDGTESKERIIYSGAFQGITSLKTVVLPDVKGDTLDIQAYAFALDKDITSIKGSRTNKNVLPATIVNLSKGVFYCCKSLPSIVVNDIEGKKEAPTLGDYLFEHCEKMVQATLPASVTKVPKHCFYGVPLKNFANVFKNVENYEKITKFGNLAFYGNQFEIVDLSAYKGLQEIGAGAFAFWDIVLEDGEECEKSKDSVIPEDKVGQLQKVILPDELEKEENKGGTLFLNTAPFYGQISMTTFITNKALRDYPQKVKDNVFYVPDYLTIGNARAVFGATGVSQTIWQADIDKTANQDNRWKDVPVLVYANCPNITNTIDVMPDGDYVETIGKAAFCNAIRLQTADLSKYTKLSNIGSGSLSYSESHYKGVFSECFALKEVILPESTAEEFVLGEETFYKEINEDITAATCSEPKRQDALLKVNMGNITEMGERAFAGCIVLKDIRCSLRLKEIPKNAFKNCISLQNVDFGQVEYIDEKAFYNCKAIELREQVEGLEEWNCQLPDCLNEIGKNAFEIADFVREDDMGTAVFGPNLVTIGSCAFKSNGISKVDFKKAQNLETIGDTAFYNCWLENFELSGTKVSVLETSVLAGCLKLQSVSLGEEVQNVRSDAMAGCPKLAIFQFPATTLVDQKAFNASVVINGNDYVTSENIAITVKTPKSTELPIDRTNLELPFYIYAEGESEARIKYMLIDSSATPVDSEEHQKQDETIKEYLKVHAKLTSGYYWHNPKDSSNKIDDKDYYEKVAKAATTSYNNTSVDVITIDTLKAGNYLLQIGSSKAFFFGNVSKTIDFTTTYNIDAKEMHYNVGIYKQKTWDTETGTDVFDELLKESDTIQVTSGSGSMIEMFYQIEGTEQELAAVDTYNIVVKTDNKDILYPKTDWYDETPYSDELGCVTEVYANGSVQNSWMRFYFVPKSVGTAHITVYPVGHEDWAKQYAITVNSDIKAITLAVPPSYQDGIVSVGDKFNVFSNYTNMFDTVVDGSMINQNPAPSNRKIQYSSDAPEYASVDVNTGDVTVLKADASDKDVWITAIAKNSDESEVRQDVKITIKGDPTIIPTNPENPTTPSNPEIPSDPSNPTSPSASLESTTQATTEAAKPSVSYGQVLENVIPNMSAQVTKVAENGAGGEVAITTINNKNATKVSIPATVMVDGVPYQVTEISSDLCSGFKKLKAVAIPASVKKIGDGAFQNCKKLKKVVIPKGVESIGSNAFYGCKSLKLITVKSTVLKSVGSNAFYGIHKKAKIKVPKKKYKAYKSILSNKGQKKSVKIKK